MEIGMGFSLQIALKFITLTVFYYHLSKPEVG